MRNIVAAENENATIPISIAKTNHLERKRLEYRRRKSDCVIMPTKLSILHQLAYKIYLAEKIKCLDEIEIF